MANRLLFTRERFQFFKKAPYFEKHSSVDARLARLRENYGRERRMKTTVEGILLIHEHRHPHLLLLKIGENHYKLPGGRLRPGEDELQGLRRKLSRRLADESLAHQPNWQIGECVAIWWRPSFEDVMYPYCPPHITRPKECRKIFMVHLYEGMRFAVPRNIKLSAVPFFEIHDNQWNYGPIISEIPCLLSRFQFNFED